MGDNGLVLPKIPRDDGPGPNPPDVGFVVVGGNAGGGVGYIDADQVRTIQPANLVGHCVVYVAGIVQGIAAPMTPAAMLRAVAEARAARKLHAREAIRAAEVLATHEALRKGPLCDDCQRDRDNADKPRCAACECMLAPFPTPEPEAEA